MGLYLLSNTPSLPGTWKRMAIRAASEEEVQALINLVGDQETFISASLTYDVTKRSQKDIQSIYGDAFNLPGQAGEVARKLMSWGK